MAVATKECHIPFWPFDMDWMHRNVTVVAIRARFDSPLFWFCIFLSLPSHSARYCPPAQSKTETGLATNLPPPWLIPLLLPFYRACVYEQDPIRASVLGWTSWSPAVILWICLHAFLSEAPADPWAPHYHLHESESTRFFKWGTKVWIQTQMKFLLF